MDENAIMNSFQVRKVNLICNLDYVKPIREALEKVAFDFVSRCMNAVSRGY